MHIKAIAKYQANISQVRAQQRAVTTRTTARAIAAAAISGLATYAGYSAETGRPIVRNSSGQAEVQQSLANSGLQYGQLVEFDKRALDTMPRIKSETTVLPVPGGGPELIWGALVRLRRYLGNAVVAGTPLPYYASEFWLGTPEGWRQLLRLNDFEEIFEAGGPSTPRPVFARLSIDSNGVYYADFRINYGNDPFDNNNQFWVNGFPRAAAPGYHRVHLQLANGVVSETTLTESFRGYMNRPFSDGLQPDPNQSNNPDRFTQPCYWTYQTQPHDNISLNTNLLYKTGIVYDLPSGFPSQYPITPEQIESGVTVPIGIYSLVDRLEPFFDCPINFQTAAELTAVTVPATPFAGPPFSLPPHPPLTGGSAGTHIPPLVVAFVAVYVD